MLLASICNAFIYTASWWWHFLPHSFLWFSPRSSLLHHYSARSLILNRALIFTTTVAEFSRESGNVRYCSGCATVLHCTRKATTRQCQLCAYRIHYGIACTTCYSVNRATAFSSQLQPNMLYSNLGISEEACKSFGTSLRALNCRQGQHLGDRTIACYRQQGIFFRHIFCCSLKRTWGGIQIAYRINCFTVSQ